MLNQIKLTVLTACILLLTACSSSQTTHNFQSMAQQSRSKVFVALNDKVIINPSPDHAQWWVLYASKNSNRQLSFDLHPNKRQHALTFNEPGEFVVTSVKKNSSGQVAQFKRTLTFIVN